MANIGQSTGGCLVVVGIDIGASGARVAAARAGEAPRLLRMPDGAEELASLVVAAPRDVVLGHGALARAVTEPEHVVRDPLRTVAATGLASPAWRATKALIAELLARVERELGDKPSALLCVEPRRANNTPSPHLLSLLRGFELARAATVGKATAAAAGVAAEVSHAHVLTVDVGASHVHVACTERRQGLEGLVISERSLPHGGAELDAALVQVAVQRLGGFSADPGAREMLRQLCAAQKPQLIEARSATFEVPPFLAPHTDSPVITLSREDFDAALAPVRAAVQRACLEVRAEAAHALDGGFDAFVLGGLCHVPAIREDVEAAVGKRPRVHSVLGALALGATRIAAERSGSMYPPRAASSQYPPTVHVVQRPPAPVSMLPPAPAPAPESPQAHWRTLSAPPARASAPPPARASAPPPARASAPPPARGSSVPPSAQSLPPPRASVPPPPDTGAIRNPTQARELLAISLSSTTGDAIALPAVLVSLAMHARTATLVLTPEAGRPLQVSFVDGRAMLNDLDAQTLAELHHVPRMRYAIEPGTASAPGKLRPRGALAIVFDGLRRLARGFSDREMQEALGAHLDQAPRIGPELAEKLVRRLELSSLEARVLSFSFERGASAREVVASDPLRRHTILSLLIGLQALKLIEWTAPRTKATRSLADELNERAASLASANHFDVLRVHWSATGQEIEHAHAELQMSLALGTPAYAAAPAACTRILERADVALAELAHPERRAHYRKRIFPNIDLEGVEDFLDKKARAMSLQQGGAGKAREVFEHKREVARSKKDS